MKAVEPNRNVLARSCLLALGFLFLALAVVGAFLPVLPTTPFLLVAAACFARSSPAFHRRLLANRVFGPYLVQWQHDHSVPREAKRKAYEVLDLGIQTGKIAFDQSGRRAAFAVPEGAARSARGRGLPVLDETGSRELSGIFVLDRERRRISRVRGSEDASRLAFPDFVGGDSIIFLLSGLPDGEPSRFRLVCCIR